MKVPQVHRDLKYQHNQKKMESQSSNPFTDAPVSAQNFMTDLKSLAEGLKQFDDPQPNPQNLPPPPHMANASHASQNTASNSNSNYSGAPSAQLRSASSQSVGSSFSAQLRSEISQAQALPTSVNSDQSFSHQSQNTTHSRQPSQPLHQTVIPAPTHAPTLAASLATSLATSLASNPAPNLAQAAAVAPQLNSNSQYMIREVKEKFNLSSDLEALNMLVAIAYKNLKSLID